MPANGFSSFIVESSGLPLLDETLKEKVLPFNIAVARKNFEEQQ